LGTPFGETPVSQAHPVRAGQMPLRIYLAKSAD